MPKNKNKIKLLQRSIRQENSILYPYCRGRGINVDCGGNKIHPNAIGIDITPKGMKCIWGRQKGIICQADIQASSDNLFMFKDNELDYVVSSHSLEYYQNAFKNLREWKRVLKPGGILGVILRDDLRIDTMKPCTPQIFKNAVELIGGFKIIKLGECLKGRSFVCVMKKRKK